MKTLLYVLLFALAANNNVFAAQTKKQVKLRIQAQSGNLDETIIYFDQAIAPQYIPQQDAEKVIGTAPGVPVIYSLTSDNKKAAINGYGTLMNTEVVALGVKTDTDGSFDIYAPVLDNFDPTSIIRLEDKVTGNMIDLRGEPYNFQLAAADPETGRFYLHISTPFLFSTVDAGCSNNDGIITLNLDPSVTWNEITLYDNANNMITSAKNANGQVVFRSLPEGNYSIVFNYGAYITTRAMFLNGNYIVTQIAASTLEAHLGENITFTSSSTNATRYAWDFGDGSTIAGIANPDFVYRKGGDYMVSLEASNEAGCSYTDKIHISVMEVTGVNKPDNHISNIITTRKTLIINMYEMAIPRGQIEIFNLLGQPVYVSNVTNQQMTVSLDDQPDGYYLVAFKSNGKTDTHKIYISR